VHYIIYCGAEVNSIDGFGLTALHYAAIYGRTDVVAILLEAGADIDAPDPHGWTALHMAADSGHIDVVRLLIEEGADLDAAVGEASARSPDS
jgi:ankyrin repeat protein